MLHYLRRYVYEAGIQFNRAGTPLFYLWNDDGSDALKIEASGLAGETDATPRMEFPLTTKNIHMALSGGNVGIGTNNPSERLHIEGSIRGNISGALRISSGSGYLDVGAQNPTWAHLYTDRPNFMFNQNIWSITGGFSSYNSADLTLQTNGTSRVVVSNATGNVGVGTTSPQGRLHVSGGDLLLQNSSSGYPILWLKDVSGTNTLRLDYNSLIGAGGNLVVRSGSSNALVLNDVGGNVGIGTANPSQKLTVNGTIYGKEVKVNLAVPGPDYVFETNYNLPSLQEIKKYIDANKHLPEVPSAKEMEANGINLGEMDMILLKKIEELTLYILEQQKQLDNQQKEIQSLKEKKQ